MRIRIISDGTSSGTKVVDADTGAMIENVVTVSWNIDGDHRDRGRGMLAEATLTIWKVPVEIIADVSVVEIRTIAPADILFAPTNET